MSTDLNNTLNDLEEQFKREEEQARKVELAEKEKQLRKKQLHDFEFTQEDLISQNEVEKVREYLKLDETKKYAHFNSKEYDYSYSIEFYPYKTDNCPSPEMADVLIKDACIRYGRSGNVAKYVNRIINAGLKEDPKRIAEWIGVLKDNNFTESFKVYDMASYEKAIGQGLSKQCFDFESVVREYYNAKCGYLVDTPCGQGDSFTAYRKPNQEVALRKKKLLTYILSRGYKPNIEDKSQVRCFLTELAGEKSMNITEKDFFEETIDYGVHRGFARMILPPSSEKLPIPKQFNSGFKGFCEGYFEGPCAQAEDFIGLVYAVSDDGTVIKAECRDGQLHGNYQKIDPNGHVIEEKYYENGVDKTRIDNIKNKVKEQKETQVQQTETKKAEVQQTEGQKSPKLGTFSRFMNFCRTSRNK